MSDPGHEAFMALALRLAARARGATTPNPLVGAVLVRRGEILGRGIHRRAGGPHAEIEALRDAQSQGHRTRGATLYVTLEPCCTHGRTPPCTDAILDAGIRRVIVAATDPNPRHAGRGLDLLRKGGVIVEAGVLDAEATQLNEIFNHWIVTQTPFVTLKIAQTLDGKIATADGDSQWVTGVTSRREAQRLRRTHDGILVGIETLLQDDPALTVRWTGKTGCPRRFILDTRARTPLHSQVVTDAFAHQTTLVVGPAAPARRVATLARRVRILTAPLKNSRIDLAWLMHALGHPTSSTPPLTSLLVEGGGEVHASFLEARLAHRFTTFLAPKVLGGRNARRSVGGQGFSSLETCPRLIDVESRRFGPDLMFTGRIEYPMENPSPN